MIPGKIVPDIFSELPVSAFFTTRVFDAEARLLKEQLSTDELYLPIQKHTGEVVIIEHDLTPVIADSVLTRRKRLAIGVQTADCVPILLYDPVRQIAGAVHAGWRGSAAGIIRNTIETMREHFFSASANIILAIGPSIKGSCYRVGEDVAGAITKATCIGDYVFTTEGRFYVDLPAANRLQALSEGILPEHIWMSDECTHCLPEKYYSYRYSNETAGRQYAYISIR
jgi:YfiH family protein